MKMKNILSSAIVLIFFFTSCTTEWLDVPNENSITTDDFWVSESAAVLGINGVYSFLIGQGPGLRTRDVFSRTDEFTSYYGWAEAAEHYKGSIANAAFLYDQMFNTMPFGNAYSGIFSANQVIEKVPEIEMDEQLKKRIIAEAKFIKAYFFFNLTTLWGNVPFADKLMGDQTSGYPSRTQEELWMLIENNLIEAKAALPVQYNDPDDLGRITKGAASALLARTYMQQHKWEEAKAELNELINGNVYNYQLVSNFSDNFTEANEFNEESVFEIMYAGYRGAITKQVFNHYSVIYGPFTSQLEATAGIIKEFELSSKYYNSGNPDPRRDETFIWSGMDPTIKIYGQVYADFVQRGDIVNWLGDDKKNHQWVRKYLDDRTKTGANAVSGINIRVIRYADVLLMYAECLNNTGETSKAYKYINEVRGRAGIDPLTSSNLLVDLAKDELLYHGFSLPVDEKGKMQIQIEYERIWELTGESIRLLDLIRWGYYEAEATNKMEVLKFTDPDYERWVMPRNALLPYPTNEVDNNPGLEQNPGY